MEKYAKEQYQETLDKIMNNGIVDDNDKEIIKSALTESAKGDKAEYIAILEAKVYAYESIIAKSNFKSMLDNGNQNRRYNNRNNQPYNNRNNNSNGNSPTRSHISDRSQDRNQGRTQNRTQRRSYQRRYNNINNDNGVEE